MSKVPSRRPDSGRKASIFRSSAHVERHRQAQPRRRAAGDRFFPAEPHGSLPMATARQPNGSRFPLGKAISGAATSCAGQCRAGSGGPPAAKPCGASAVSAAPPPTVFRNWRRGIVITVLHP